MKKLTEIDRMNKIINDFCKKYKISIQPKRYKSSVGRAIFDTREIKIPEIDSVENFLIALHEIGHILHGYIEPEYLSEYLVDKWCIETAKNNGVIDLNYNMRSKWYLLRQIANYHNQHKIYEIPQEVIDYTGEDIKTWNGFIIEVYYNKSALSIKKTLK